MGSEDGTTEDRLAWDRGWARWALQRWEPFPVDRLPRPLVLTGSPFRFERGFRSGEAKLAFLYGDIRAAVPLPDGLLEVLRGGEDGPPAVPGSRRWSSPLLVTQASPDHAESVPTAEGANFLPGASAAPTSTECSGYLTPRSPPRDGSLPGQRRPSRPAGCRTGRYRQPSTATTGRCMSLSRARGPNVRSTRRLRSSRPARLSWSCRFLLETVLPATAV
jgi:hypothetical protein